MALWKKILIAMVAIILCVSLVIGITAFDLTGKVVKDFESEIVELSANTIAEQIREVFISARDVLTTIVEKTDAQKVAERVFLDSKDLEQGSVEFKNDLESYLVTLSRTGSDTFHFINIYLENGINAVTSKDGRLPYNSFEDVCNYLDNEQILARDAYLNLVWYDIMEVRNDQGNEEECFLCVRFIYDRVTMERIGAVVAGVETDNIRKIYKSLFPEALIVTIWADVVKNSPSEEEISNELLANLLNDNYSMKEIVWEENGSQRVALCWKIANGYAWFVVPLREMDLLKSNVVLQYFAKLGVVVALAILVASVASVAFSKAVTDGLAKLKRTAQRVAEGERNIRFTPKKHDEVAYVGIQFNQMLDQLEKNYLDLQLSEKEKSELELSLLYAKINPHLLYNTLDIVVWAINNDDRQRAEEIVYALSDFFKRSLAKGREYTKIEEAIALIKSYLELQCLANGKDYKLQVCVDPQMMDYQLLHLLLQPVVENSVIHGFSAFRDDGTISISARRVGDIVELHVRDDGVGITPNQIEEINKTLNEDLSLDNPRHYGLRNVARRIKVYYGKQYGMEVSSEIGEYTDVMIRIPYREMSETECIN